MNFYGIPQGLPFPRISKIKPPYSKPRAQHISRKLTFPKVGEQIQIIPSYVENAELFFANIVTSNWKQDLQSLNYRLNHPAEKINMNKFNPLDLPRNGELVFSQYIDGNFYRAKVIQFYKDTIEFKVFYCDYGNFEMVPFQKLRQWQKKYDNLPFQAVLCKLYNVKDNPWYRREVTEFLSDLLVNKQFSAEVKGNDNILVLDLKTEDGKSTISGELHKKNIAKPLFEEAEVNDEYYMDNFLKRDKYNIPDYLC
ncbi:hypothetical protein ACFFRR_010262 [Megaselia abdita]